MKFENETSTKNKKNDYTFGHDKDTTFVYSGNSQNYFSSSQIKENDNIISLPNPGSSTSFNGASFNNEIPRDRNDLVSSGQNGQNRQYGQNGQNGQNDNLQSTPTYDYQGNNEINEDFFGEYKGFNSIYVGIGRENIDLHQLKQCLEENFGHVRFIRIIRNKVKKKTTFVLIYLPWRLYNSVFFFFFF
jgi:hypothetical protein